MSLYLDYNASTPIDERVLEEMIAVYRNNYGNADSRTHDYGTNAQKKVENARKQVASLLGVSKNEVVFTSGATESNNMAILGLAEYGLKNNKMHIITTSIEHKAILEPLKILEKRGFEIDYISPNESGRIDEKKLLDKIRPETLLVSISHANNETGIIQPIKAIGAALLKTDVYFHIDAAQSCGKLVDELKSTPYNLLTLTGHKMYGPQGIGALILRIKNYKKPPIAPIMYGGNQENGLRPGTLPVALIVGLGKACEIAELEYKDINQQYLSTKKSILDLLKNSGIQYLINGEQKYCMQNTLSVSFLGIDSEALMLATKQFCSVSNGAACTSHDYKYSHVLSSMGLSESRAESAIRISWGKEYLDITILKKMINTIKTLI